MYKLLWVSVLLERKGYKYLRITARFYTMYTAKSVCTVLCTVTISAYPKSFTFRTLLQVESKKGRWVRIAMEAMNNVPGYL